MGLLKIAMFRFVDLLEFLILLRIILSLIIRDYNNSFMEILYRVTEPILNPMRELINKTGIDTGMFDFSPILAFLLLGVVRTIVGLL